MRANREVTFLIIEIFLDLSLIYSREGGGCVTGKVDENGQLTGQDILYIYPDCRDHSYFIESKSQLRVLLIAKSYIIL